MRKDGKWIYEAFPDSINEVDVEPIWDGIKLFEDDYTWLKERYANGCFGVLKGDKWALMNNAGILLTEYKYEWIEGRFKSGYFVSKVKVYQGGIGFIDINGKEYFEDDNCQNK